MLTSHLYLPTCGVLPMLMYVGREVGRLPMRWSIIEKLICQDRCLQSHMDCVCVCVCVCTHNFLATVKMLEGVNDASHYYGLGVDVSNIFMLFVAW